PRADLLRPNARQPAPLLAGARRVELLRPGELLLLPQPVVVGAGLLQEALEVGVGPVVLFLEALPHLGRQLLLQLLELQIAGALRGQRVGGAARRVLEAAVALAARVVVDLPGSALLRLTL